MKSINIEIRNLEKLTSLANKFPKVAQKHIDKAIVDSISEVHIEVQPITPVKTARLKNSMVPIFSPFKGSLGTKVEYARRVHDMYSVGSPYKHRNPTATTNMNAVAGFMVVAVQRAKNVINNAFAKALNDIVVELAK